MRSIPVSGFSATATVATPTSRNVPIVSSAASVSPQVSMWKVRTCAPAFTNSDA